MQTQYAQRQNGHPFNGLAGNGNPFNNLAGNGNKVNGLAGNGAQVNPPANAPVNVPAGNGAAVVGPPVAPPVINSQPVVNISHGDTKFSFNFGNQNSQNH